MHQGAMSQYIVIKGAMVVKLNIARESSVLDDILCCRLIHARAMLLLPQFIEDVTGLEIIILRRIRNNCR